MWGNLTQLSPFDVLQTVTQDYSASNGQNPETTPGTIGSRGFTTDGRQFRLGTLATNATTLATNKNTQGPAQVAALHLGTVSATAIGDTSLVYTFAGGATSLALNALAGGFISIVTGTGSVQQLQISGNAVATSATTVQIQLQDPIVIATSSSATAEVYVNPYSAVIIAPASALTGVDTGVPMVAVTANANQPVWAWFQTSGMATVLGQGTTGIGLGATNSTSTAGALAVVAATVPEIARATEAGADGLYTVWELGIN